jgi:DNA-binding MarR family transcriptional regulator
LTTSFDAGANRLGALALRITDRIEDARREAGPGSDSATAALSALHRFLDEPSIDELRRVLGLSSSATVRLVDGLVADGFVMRSTAGGDERRTAVTLTPNGKRRARQLIDARADTLVDALAPLSPAERATFDALVDKILVGLVPTPTSHGWMCRLCDTETCGAPRGEPCPITRTAFA